MRRQLHLTVILALASLMTIFVQSAVNAEAWTVTRVAGLDRFETAVRVSATYFSPGTKVVVLANGTNFADSLSGSALATRLDSPLLLVRKDEVPEVVGAEIVRLNPGKVIVLGGTAAIAASVVTQVEALLPVEVVRLGGATRYETSQLIVQYGWESTATSVFLATGEGYPAGLLAGAAAGFEDSPVLLTRPQQLEVATSNLIKRLNPQKLRVVAYGSSGAGYLSQTVIDSARALTSAQFLPAIGNDLYEVASSLATISGGVTPTVVLTTSEAFPDALSAGAAAGFLGHTLLMTAKSCMPEEVGNLLSANATRSITVIGGTAAISDAAATGTPCPTGVTAGQDWRTAALPAGVSAAAVEREVTTALGDTSTTGRVRSVVVTYGDKIVYERYHPQDTAQSVMATYSVSKSITAALIGMLIGDGRLSLDQKAPVAAWSGPTDPRNAITIRNLLHMASGLQWTEGYSDPNSSTLALIRADDAAAYAASLPLESTPGSVFEYNSGNSAILMGIVTNTLGGPAATDAYINDRLLDPLGITSTTYTRDKTGKILGYMGINMSARDLARFGLLFLNDGMWGTKRILPAGWVDFSKAESPASPTYAGHWWTYEDDYSATGFGAQYIVVAPTKNLVIVITTSNRFDSLFGLPSGSESGQAVRAYVLRDKLYDLFPTIR